MKGHHIVICLVFLLVHFSGVCQYLEASRPATIKGTPNRDAEVFEKLEKNDKVWLLDNGRQVNGYYLVRTTDEEQAGYLYRTLARRYNGPIPGLIANSHFFIANTDINWDPIIPSEYYHGTENLEGDWLKNELHEIIKDHDKYPYTSSNTDVWDILRETDQDPQNSENVILIYSGFSTNGGQEYNEGKGWEREHVWTKSHGKFGTTQGAGTDVHHLRPVKREFNGSDGKWDRDFDEGGEDFLFEDDQTGCFVSDSTWAPIEKYRGDVARMMFYMAVRYEGTNGEPDLELVDWVYTKNHNKYMPVHGKLSILLKWHTDDPVDNWERRRNDIIYEHYQNNRNPFIDNPEFANKIWE